MQGSESFWQRIVWFSAIIWGPDAPPLWRLAVHLRVLPPRLSKFWQLQKRYAITAPAVSTRCQDTCHRALNDPCETSDDGHVLQKLLHVTSKESPKLWHGLLGLHDASGSSSAVPHEG